MIILVILIPIIAGALVPMLSFKKRWHMEVFLESAVILNSILAQTHTHTHTHTHTLTQT